MAKQQKVSIRRKVYIGKTPPTGQGVIWNPTRRTMVGKRLRNSGLDNFHVFSSLQSALAQKVNSSDLAGPTATLNLQKKVSVLTFHFFITYFQIVSQTHNHLTYYTPTDFPSSHILTHINTDMCRHIHAHTHNTYPCSRTHTHCYIG